MFSTVTTATAAIKTQQQL